MEYIRKFISLLLFYCFFVINSISAQFPSIQDNDTSFVKLAQKYDVEGYKSDSLEEGGSFTMVSRMMYNLADRLYPSYSFIVRDNAINDYVNSAIGSMNRSVSFCNYFANWIEEGPTTNPSTGSSGNLFGNGTGQIHDVAFDPDFNSNGLMYAASGFGGVFISQNFGQNWSNFFTDKGLPIVNVGGIAVDQLDGQNIFIATGNSDDRTVPSIGVYKFDHIGNSWIAKNNGLWSGVQANKSIQKIIYSPLSSDILFLATSTGIYRTTTATTSCDWLQQPDLINFNDPFVCDIEFHPANSSIVYASGKDVYRSSSGGVSGSWGSITGPGTGLDFTLAPLAGLDVEYSQIAVSPDNSNILYLIFLAADNSPLPANEPILSKYIYKYDGASWTFLVNVPLVVGNDVLRYMNFEVSPNDVDAVYVGQTVTFRYNFNISNSYQVLYAYHSTAIHPDIHCLRFGPNNNDLYVGHDGGLSKTIDPTLASPSWIGLNNGLGVGTIVKIGSSPSDQDGLVIIGSQDEGCALLDRRPSNPNLNKWSFLEGYGDGADAVIFPDNNNWIASSAYNLNYMTHFDAQLGISNKLGNPGAEYDKNFFAPLAYDEANKSLLASWRNIYRKDDLNSNSPSSWTRLSDLDVFTFGACVHKLKCIAISSSNPNYLYAANEHYIGHSGGCARDPYDQRMFRTKYGGVDISKCPPLAATKCWEEISPSTITGTFNISSIAISETDPEEIYISYSGYDASRKVFHSVDAGDNWINYSTGLPNLPINVLIAEKGTNGSLYAGTDAGVYYRNKFMSSWECFDNGLPNVRVSDLEIDYGSNRIYAGTYGRALWSSVLACPLNLDLALTSAVVNSKFEEVQDKILSTEQINSGEVTYRAGNYIELNPDFEITASSSTSFYAFIHACDHVGNSFKVQRIKNDKVENPEYVSDLKSLKVFPNPSTGIFEIELTHADMINPYSFRVSNLVGEIIRVGNSSGNQKIRIDLTNEVAGIYLVHLVKGDDRQAIKLIKY